MTDYATGAHAEATGRWEYNNRKKPERVRNTETPEMGSMDNSSKVPEEAGPNGMAPNAGEHEEHLSDAVARKGPGNPFFSPFVRDLQRRGLAVGHPDPDHLGQSSTNLGPTVTAGSDKPTFVGGAGFHSAFSRTDSPEDADHGMPRVRMYDAAADADVNGILHNVRHDLGDEHSTGHYESAPIGQNNGTHFSGSQYGARTADRPSMKMSAFEIMKAYLRGEL